MTNALLFESSVDNAVVLNYSYVLRENVYFERQKDIPVVSPQPCSYKTKNKTIGSKHKQGWIIFQGKL